MGLPRLGIRLLRAESEVLFVYVERAVLVRNKVFFGLLRGFVFQFLHQYALTLTRKQGLAFVDAHRQIGRKAHAVV